MRKQNIRNRNVLNAFVLVAAVLLITVPKSSLAVSVVRAPLPSPDMSPTPVIGYCPACPYEMCALCGTNLLPPPCDLADVSLNLQGELRSTVVQEDVCAEGVLKGGFSEDILWNRYGVTDEWTFAVEGPITYDYVVPYTLRFDMSGCVTPGRSVRIKNVQLVWGSPTLTAIQDAQFRTSQYVWADFPGDGLDDLVLGFTQYTDHLDLWGRFPLVPLVPSVPYEISLGQGTPFDDGTACYSFACNTLGGRTSISSTQTTETVYAGSIPDERDNEILVRADWGSPRTAWSSTAEQIELASKILLGIDTPPTLAIGGALWLFDVAGFDLTTNFGLNIQRRDTAWLYGVKVPRDLGKVDMATPPGDTQMTFQLPITYGVNLDSDFRYPLSFRVDFDGPFFDSRNIISTPSGEVLWASNKCYGETDWAKQAIVSFTVPVRVTAFAGEAPDTDADGFKDDADNCPVVANVDQRNSDSDPMGDACDPDDDNDGVLDEQDNCPVIANQGQTDLDGDGIGDLCDADVDGDGVGNESDSCPLVANTDQEDSDQDGYGDACDPDDDNDRVDDADDNCPLVFNPNQADLDADSIGDVCDGDADADGVATGDDNCPSVANVNQLDFDRDAIGDACDPDIDADGVLNEVDVCQFTPAGIPVDSGTGCTVAQQCPCGGPFGTTEPWRSHGIYVSCVANTSERLAELGIITVTEKDLVVSNAAQSNCGNKK